MLNKLKMLLIGLLLICTTGCAYMRYRAEDAADILELGITVSAKPKFSIYGSGISMLTVGYSNFEGRFIGIGGSRIGWPRHANKCWGVAAVGHEIYAWGDDYDLEDPATLHQQYVGPLGVLVFPVIESRPSYMPACIHLIHLGFVGIVGNIRYTEALDFVLGFAGLDVSGDDGPQMASWPWKRLLEGVDE